MKNNHEFMEYIISQLNKNTVYMWGEYGRLVTNQTITSKKSQYPSHYDETKTKYLKSLIDKNYYAFDCAGLIKSYWMSNYGKDKVKYNSKYDYDAYGITLGLAGEKGSINTLPEIPGILLYMKGHCGIYKGNNEVIECTSNEKISKIKYGKVCISKLSDRKWTHWTKIKWLDYSLPISNKEEENKYYIVQKGDNLTKISKMFNTTIQELVKINNIADPNLILVNQKLIIPNNPTTYVVQKGDTLSKIAQKYNTTWQNIYNKNKKTIANPNKIYVGQIINI